MRAYQRRWRVERPRLNVVRMRPQKDRSPVETGELSAMWIA